MKTAEQIAEEVANEVMVGMQDRDDVKRITKALHEYGEIVRQRAAVMCEKISGNEPSGRDGRFGALDCAAAIERMPLP